MRENPPAGSQLEYTEVLSDKFLSFFGKKSQQFYSDHEEGTQSGLLAFALPLLRTGALVPAEASCTHPPPQRVQTNLGESPLALGSLMLVDDPGFYLAVNK